MKAFAAAVIAGQSDFARASLETRAEPTPMQTAPALIHSPAFSRATPPVGVSFRCGRGARRSLKYCGPSAVEGNTLTISAPAFAARRISVGVRAPGIATLSLLSVASTTSGLKLGET